MKLMTIFTKIPFSPGESSSDGLGLPGIIFQNSLMLEPPVGLPGTGLSLYRLVSKALPRGIQT